MRRHREAASISLNPAGPCLCCTFPFIAPLCRCVSGRVPGHGPDVARVVLLATTLPEQSAVERLSAFGRYPASRWTRAGSGPDASRGNTGSGCLYKFGFPEVMREARPSRRLRRGAVVAVAQAVHLWNLNDVPAGGRRDGSRGRRVLAEPQVPESPTSPEGRRPRSRERERQRGAPMPSLEES